MVANFIKERSTRLALADPCIRAFSQLHERPQLGIKKRARLKNRAIYKGINFLPYLLGANGLYTGCQTADLARGCVFMQNPFGNAAHNFRLSFFKRCLRCSLITGADSGFDFLDESPNPANPAFVNLSAIRVTDDALFCRFMISHKAVPQNKCSNVGARYAQTRC